MTFSKTELANPVFANNLAGMLADAKHGGFMVVKNLVTKGGHGEVADYCFCKGISYPNAVQKSINDLENLLNDATFSIKVVRGTWQDGAGNESPTGRKSKAFPVPVVVSKTYMAGDAALSEAFERVMKSLVAPAPVEKEYTHVGNGVYSDETGMFLRDLRLISKKVVKKGDYPFSASGETVAIADAIKRMLPVGKYRMFRLDADYETISLDNTVIVQTEEQEMIEA